MIIDTHTHLGTSKVSDSNFTEEKWLTTMERFGLDGILSYPLPEAAPSYKEGNDRVARFAKKYPGKVWGVADINPGLDEEEYFAEAERCVKELGFVAIKMHPAMHGCRPGSKHSAKVYECARHLGVPVIVHTGTGIPYALPTLMLPIAKQYPDLKIVLAHAGSYVFTDEAIIVAQECDNVWLEPSWCSAGKIRAMINTVGLERVMYGSDGPTNVPVELAKVIGAEMTDDEKDAYLGGNAIKFYGLKTGK